MVFASCGDAPVLETEPPQPLASPPATDSLPRSVVSVPVEVSLETLERVVERHLPQRVGDLENRRRVGDEERLEVAFEVERGPLHSAFDGRIARISSTLGYRVRAWYDPPVLPTVSASCGTDDGLLPRLDASVSSPLTLDREWRIRSDVRLAELTPASNEDRDRCTVTVFDFDVTRYVIDGTVDAIADVTSKADSAISSIDVRSDFSDWWDVIANPIELDEDIWLVLRPSSAGRGSIGGDGEDVQTVLTLRLSPRIHIGPEPDHAALPFPPLDSVSSAPGVAMIVEATAPWHEVTRRVSSEFVGQSYRAAGRRIRVDALRVGGVGDGRLFLEVGMEGDVTGTVFLVGTPTYNPEADEIHIPDLDFDVSTREVLVESAAWLAEVGLLDWVRSRTRWSAAGTRQWASEQAERGFNTEISSQVALEGVVDEVTIERVFASGSNLTVRAGIRGDVRLIVDAGETGR